MKHSAIKSMTASSRKDLETEIGSFIFEIHSLNRRFLEITLFLPRLLSSFDMQIRGILREKLMRGVVTLTVTYIAKDQTNKILANLNLAKELKSAWRKIADELQLDFAKEFSLSFLKDVKEVVQVGGNLDHDERLSKILEEGVLSSIESLMEMKEREGETLKEDLLKRLNTLQELLLKIEAYSGRATTLYFEKVKSRLALLLNEEAEKDERILREIALLAEKSDYTEEIVRFRSHINQLRLFLEAPLKEAGESRGKKMDFLIQELGREINTIGSKALDVQVSHLVVEIKAELEKIREQIQNIE